MLVELVSLAHDVRIPASNATSETASAAEGGGMWTNNRNHSEAKDNSMHWNSEPRLHVPGPAHLVTSDHNSMLKGSHLWSICHKLTLLSLSLAHLALNGGRDLRLVHSATAARGRVQLLQLTD